MSTLRQAQRKSRSGRNRPGRAYTPVRQAAPRGAAPSPAQLQQRLGNRGVQAWLAQGSDTSGAQRTPADGASRERVQRQEKEEDELLQGKFAGQQAPAQRQADVGSADSRTGIPDSLKAGVEALSGEDLSGVRVHRNSPKPAQLDALAYTQGQDIHLGPAQEKHLPHEAWHAVQQRQGRVQPQAQAKGVAINDDAGLEREADVMGAKAVQMTHKPISQRRDHPGSAFDSNVIQRFAFINEKQLGMAEKGLTPAMKAMVSDNLVRNYKSLKEFDNHAAKKTDYLGNLASKVKTGTWLRFSPTGMNILGEYHTQVQLSDVVPAVGTKSFIFEQFSSDIMKEGSHIKTAYRKANELEFMKFGIEKEPDVQVFGAESLFPKLGYTLNMAIPYFEKRAPIDDLKSGDYVGKPIQRYLKIAWGHSKDNKILVKQKKAAGEKIPPKTAKLAAVHRSVEGKLDKFITSLPVDGHIGDELVKKKNSTLFKPLAEFSHAFTEAMVERAAKEKSSRLSTSERKKYAKAKSTGEAEKRKLFSEWRDYYFEDVVKAAAKKGVRYAGMGQAHLDHLKKVGLPSNSHPYEMAGKDIANFEALTKKLAKKAKKP